MVGRCRGAKQRGFGEKDLQQKNPYKLGGLDLEVAMKDVAISL